MDEIINKLMASVLDLAEAVRAQTAISERLLAGQEQALARVDAGSSGTAGPRKRRTKEEIAADKAAEEAEDAAGNASADTESSAPAATTAADPKPEVPAAAAEAATPTPPAPGEAPSDAWLKKVAESWFVAIKGTDAEIKAAKLLRYEWLTKVIQSFGITDSKVFTGPGSKLTPDNRKAASFYIRRANKLGMDKVSLTAKYDFDGAPDQTEPVAASAAVEDEFDPLG